MSKSGSPAWRLGSAPFPDPPAASTSDSGDRSPASLPPVPPVPPRWAPSDAAARGAGDAGPDDPGRSITLVSRSSFDVEPQTLFSLATGESVRYTGIVRCVARTWGDAAIGFRSTVELDWRGCRGLGLVRGRKYEFGAGDPATFDTAPPYPASYGLRGWTPVRTQAGTACEAVYVATLRIGADSAVRIAGIEIRGLQRARST